MPAPSGPQFSNFKEGDVVYRGVHLQKVEGSRSKFTATAKRAYPDRTQISTPVMGLGRMKGFVRNYMRSGFVPQEQGHLEYEEKHDF